MFGMKEPSVEECVEVLRHFARLDVRGCDDGELLSMAVGLEEALSLGQVASAHILTELEARNTCDTNFGMRTVPWVASQAGSSAGGIRQRLRTGRALRSHFDVVDREIVEGHRRGSVTFDHAKALTQATNPRVDDVLGGVQDEILDLAEATTFERWKADVGALVELADVEGVEPIPVEVNRAMFSISFDGLGHLDATFDPDLAVAVRGALEAKVDELFNRYRHDGETIDAAVLVPDRPQLRALAIAELIREGLSARRGQGSPPRIEMSLVLHDDQICDSDGQHLSEPAGRLAGCDADLWAVVIGSLGEPVSVGHAKRLATAAQRRAMAVRDGGCVFPGCDAPAAWVDAHHVHHWLDGGPTAIENLASLCRHHHGVTHRRGWTMHVTDDQWFWWETPAGHRFWSQRHHRRRAGPVPGDTSPTMVSQPVVSQPVVSQPVVSQPMVG